METIAFNIKTATSIWRANMKRSRATKMPLTKSDWYPIGTGLAIFADVSANELGFGTITFLLLTLLAAWLMARAFEN
jgi:hypothetical protein